MQFLLRAEKKAAESCGRRGGQWAERKKGEGQLIHLCTQAEEIKGELSEGEGDGGCKGQRELV